MLETQNEFLIKYDSKEIKENWYIILDKGCRLLDKLVGNWCSSQALPKPRQNLQLLKRYGKVPLLLFVQQMSELYVLMKWVIFCPMDWKEHACHQRWCNVWLVGHFKLILCICQWPALLLMARRNKKIRLSSHLFTICI